MEDQKEFDVETQEATVAPKPHVPPVNLQPGPQSKQEAFSGGLPVVLNTRTRGAN